MQLFIKNILRQILVTTFLLCLALAVFSQTIQLSIGTGFTNRTINAGDSISIWWNVEGAKKFYCNELGSAELPMEGSIFVSPTQSTTYIFVAEKGKSQEKKRITIEVVQPKIISFNAPEKINDEGTYSINWSAENCSYVKINGVDAEFPPEGKFMLQSAKDTTISIIAYNNAGYSDRVSKRIRVSYVENLSYPAKVKIGSSALISWKYKNTDFVKIDGIADSLPAIGEIWVSMESSKTFKISAYRSNNSIDIETFSIEAYRSKIKFFNGNTRVFAGDEVVMTWEVEDADSVKISCSRETQKLKGSFSIKPEADTEIVLYSYLNGVEDSRSLKIEIIKRKLISGEVNYTQLAKGIRLDYEIFAVDLSEYPDIVHLYVMVVDTNGNFVHGLAPPTITEKDAGKYFIGLTETYTDGGRNKVNDFRVTEVRKSNDRPRNISMVLDYSGSMESSIGELEKAAVSFIENKRSIDSLSIVKFDDRVFTECPPTLDKSDISKQVQFDGLKRYGGGTALYAAMGDGIYSVMESGNIKEIIVFTDGYENSSGYYMGSKTVSAQQVANLARETGARIHVITFGEGVNGELLKLMADYTGGNYYNVNSSSEINGVWAELPFLSANYYIVSFRTAKIDKLNGVKLLYNTNTGTNFVVGEKLYMNDTLNFFTYEGDTSSYWMKHSNAFKGMSPVTTPQMVALYDFNGAILDTSYFEKIDNIVKIMNAQPGYKLVLFGHTDLIDSDEYNLKLSERRCKSIEKFLTERGIDKNRIIMVPLGKRYPVWEVEDQKWKANENRRVEVMLVE
ncbi:MAG TPA: OmpA family protein [Bacteroidales bacterium]|nr:VWA domain-containing protein [Bacteroidales bacterium]HOE04707.1 OmpA family protein [Bacteroidales bacterium]